MTNSQFELFVMHSGMMQEGLKSEEALAHIIRSNLASSKDIAWLVDTRLTITKPHVSFTAPTVVV
jgi:hypothetical protein